MANFAGSITGSLDIGGALGGVFGGEGGGRRAFELRAGPFVQNELEVVSFTGREAISELFRFDVTFQSSIDSLALEPALLGQPATLVLQVNGRAPRIIQGIGAALRVDGKLVSDLKHQYRLRLVPKLWQLKKRRNSRIFQNMSIDQIISRLLKDWRIPYRWSLVEKRTSRQYCVQYQETDYQFITRLLSEEGIFYYFEPPSALLDQLTGGLGEAVGAAASAIGGMVGGAVGDAIGEITEDLGMVETIVFADRASAYPAIPDHGFDLSGGLMASVSTEIGAKVGELAGEMGVPSSIVDALHLPGPTIPFRTMGMAQGDECIFAFDIDRILKEKTVYLKDYDFKRPNLLLVAKDSLGLGIGGGGALGAVAGAAAGSLSSVASLSLGPGGLAASANLSAITGVTVTPGTLMTPDGFEVYDHHGEYEEQDVNQSHTHVFLEQLRKGSLAGTGKSSSRRLTAGSRFCLLDYGIDWLDQEYVLTEVEHRGKIPEAAGEIEASDDQPIVYENRFRCVLASVPFRPDRPRRVLKQVVESALVVGAGEDVFTDEFGRIKVQFHWDRDGLKNEFSSCWIRVMQPWAGTSYGVQFIPRLGMEVLVSFLGGDVDRPVVIGCVYNGTHPVPFHLPHASSRSGIRTNSMPGGNGFNELSFEDQAGKESVYIHAQRDLVEVVRNDHDLSISSNQKIRVSGEQDQFVGQGRSDTVGKDDIRSIGGNLKLTINGTEKHHTIGSRTDIIDGRWGHYAGDVSLSSYGHFNIRSAETFTVAVGNSEEGKANAAISVFGSLRTYSTKLTQFHAEEKVVLQCGTSTITLEPKKITIDAEEIEIDASKSLTAKGKGPALRLTDEAELSAKKIKLLSKGGFVELNEDKAKIFGPSVQMSSGDDPPETEDESTDPETVHLKYKMLDPAMKPYANKTYTLITQGFKVKATTDDDGMIEQDIPKDAITTEITLWADEYPTGQRVLCTVQLEKMPPGDQPRGACGRLRNLGYYRGEDVDVETPELSDALLWFQSDHEVEGTGKLDSDTIAKLKEVHPDA